MDQKLYDWVVGKIESAAPDETHREAQALLQDLTTAYRTLASGNGNVFGMAWPESASEDLAGRARKAVLQWHTHFLDNDDQASALLLAELADKVGIDIPKQQVSLEYDPLGAPEHLTPNQTKLIEAVGARVEAPGALFKRWVANERRTNNGSSGLEIVVGEPDMDALHRAAVVFERDSDRGFPPLLARFLSLWNGIQVRETDSGSETRREAEVGGADACIWSASAIQNAPDGWVIGSIYDAPLVLDTSSPDQSPIVWHNPDGEPRELAGSFEGFLTAWLTVDMAEAELTG